MAPRTTCNERNLVLRARPEIGTVTGVTLLHWLERRGGTIDNSAFPSRVVADGHLGTSPIRQAGGRVGDGYRPTPEEYGIHSLRRTKASLIYKATGNLRAVTDDR
jgi:hypothetical protein